MDFLNVDSQRLCCFLLMIWERGSKWLTENFSIICSTLAALATTFFLLLVVGLGVWLAAACCLLASSISQSSHHRSSHINAPLSFSLLFSIGRVLAVWYNEQRRGVVCFVPSLPLHDPLDINDLQDFLPS